MSDTEKCSFPVGTHHLIMVDTQDDLAALGELDRVAEQVDRGLPEPERIAYEVQRRQEKLQPTHEYVRVARAPIP